ncbi:MAG TPA: hypothetical protein VGB91_17100 [Rhizomicrobium sp.]
MIDTGPITNHVNFADNANGKFAYVTVGGLNEAQVFRRDDFTKVATIPVGNLPHGVWPSGDGTRLYVGLENADAIAVIDTSSNAVIATIPVGQAPQALNYVPNAVRHGDGGKGLQPLGVAGMTARFALGPPSGDPGKAPTSVSLFDQGLVQAVQASVTGLEPKAGHILALSDAPDGSAALQPLAAFTANAAGAAIVNATGPIRQLVPDPVPQKRRFLVIARTGASGPGAVVQVQYTTP